MICLPDLSQYDLFVITFRGTGSWCCWRFTFRMSKNFGLASPQFLISHKKPRSNPYTESIQVENTSFNIFLDNIFAGNFLTFFFSVKLLKKKITHSSIFFVSLFISGRHTVSLFFTKNYFALIDLDI